ncbi:MAG TPA: response regulator transcription factor [Terriglobia bacterium]|nr:response regulator transcription factor [Terriglobia bacterium]
MSIRILLADDHEMVRQGLKALLERDGFNVVAEASDGRQAVRLIGELEPDIALLDLAMPLMNGITVAKAIQHSASHTKIIALTIHTEAAYVLEALRAGVKGYVLKSCAEEELVRAIREILRGSTYLSSDISDLIVDAFLNRFEVPVDSLSSREMQVLQLVAEGKSTKEVACLLNISVKTAESHRTRVMEKLEVHEISGLVRYAIRRGLIEP